MRSCLVKLYRAGKHYVLQQLCDASEEELRPLRKTVCPLLVLY